ncbi:adenylate/guanylate cyclase domain-containing protein [Cronbergia sp. UHCC 0137]|uniref:adenylate/guanylate cyclase domain-containing protein n=1 Tax=Cronbergia sp. UHCC 0137 TaxID=3110239 RepID=UPI002B1F1D51|nr:adenylate/guanylate cyclase domain-containing protein [Cronbergia sp. UHCC 0137]MEA5620645.1 adenylate/guanylate cyclase domain-containing protein [Cronbergia sp. UHCC 0137]
MKLFAFRSIRTQIMISTTMLIVTLIGGTVTVWAKNESDRYLEEKLNQGKLLSQVLSSTYSNELSQENWSQIRINLDLLLKESDEFIYALVSDASQNHQIVAASPNEFQNNYIPDIVPITVTNRALQSYPKTRIIDTVILRDIYFSEILRAKRGEQVVEIASDILSLSGKKLGTLRLGVSLRRIDQAVITVITHALMVGVVGLTIGWIFAYILAHHLSDPVQRLQTSAAKIAGGDLDHRAEINHRTDEIGALANSFNEMSAALQISFNKAQKTLETFERFVPNKFIAVIAPQGIENIELGVASVRTMTIVFVDIRGYTSMSEAMAPLEIFTFLNDYLACMGEAIDKAGGFIDKYIGDAIMALFDDEATDCALKSAILMQEALSKFNLERSLQQNPNHNGLPKIAVGIGIHRGEVVMGTVGFTSRIDSTVIGDTVNVASRIEGLTKQYGCDILVTESVVNNLSYPQLFSLKLVDKSVKVKGKDEAISIYELQVDN